MVPVSYTHLDVYKRQTLSFESLTPGKTYYVRARVKNDKAATLAQKYSAYTNTCLLYTSRRRIIFWDFCMRL